MILPYCLIHSFTKNISINIDKGMNKNTLESKFGLEVTRNRNRFFASSDKRASPTAVGDARLLLSLGGGEDEKKQKEKY